MASKSDGSIWSELLRARLYKKNQGRLTRQLTAIVGWVVIVFGLYTVSQSWLVEFENTYYGVPVRFSGGSIDDSERETIQSVAADFNAVLDSDNENPSEVRVLFPTSSYWSEDEDKKTTARADIEEFAEAIQSENSAFSVNTEQRDNIRRPVPWLSTGIPVALGGLAIWVMFRIVNYPRVADFLVAVEAEMDKVSWPSKSELVRSTAVVIITMFSLAFLLLFYDMIWQQLFRLVGFLQLD